MAMSPVMVELRASIGEFKAKMAEAREEVKRLADDGARNHERFASFGKAALLGLAGVAVAVGTVSLEMADKFESSHAKLVAAMKGAGVSFEAYRPQIEATQKQMEKFGYTNADTQAALAQLTVSLKDPAKGLAQMGLVADLAKFKNIPLADSALVVAKAMEGQLRPLKALGIDLPVAAAGALRLEKAHAALAAAQDKVNALLEKYPGAVNAANKHHAMYEAATAKVTAAQAKLKDTMGETAVVLKALHERLGGQAAAAAETFGGKVLAMKVQAEDFAKNLGLMLIPILEKLMTAITKVIDWFKQHKVVAEALAITIGTILVAAIATYVVSLVVATGASVLNFAKMIAAGVSWAASTAASFASTLYLQALYARESIVNAAKVMLTYVQMGVAAVAGAAVQVAAWVSVAAAAAAAFIAENIATLGIIAAIALLIAAAYYLYKHWGQVWAWIKAATAEAWQWIQKHLLFIAAAFGPVGLAAYALYRNWTTIWDGIKSAVSSAWSYIKPIIDGITSAISSVTSAVGSLSSIGGTVSKTLSNPFSLGSFKMPDLSHMFANGTDYAPGGLSLVGERGPELLNLPRGSQVIPTSKLGSLSSVTVGNTNLTVNGNLDNVTLAQVRMVLDAHTRDLVSELRAGRR